ncbi:hypothetical protein DTO271G3_1114 [Paecilomyces variotii]|nr:hypothetical protein DTO271G3_1114 [Paecilomyces variotii]
MRPSVRLLNPLEVPSLQVSKSLYVCSTCRQEFRPQVFSASVAHRFRRHASSNDTPFTEKVRRKIWGTDNPPGLKDPYGGEGVIERAMRKRRQGAEEEVVAAEQQQPDLRELEQIEQEIAPPDDYRPASTWDSLERVGHLGRWSDYPPTEADEYHSFLSKRKLTEKGHLSLAAHQTAVELCLMHALKKPLTDVCEVLEHDKTVFKMIWKCKIQPGNGNGPLDGALVFPNKETENNLFYVFQQIGSEVEMETAAEQTAEEEVEELGEEDFDEKFFNDAAKTPDLPFFGYRDSRDSGFLSLSLQDPATKFAFLKRFSQLTGYFFPDPAVHSIKTVQQAIDYLQETINPKPKKLAPLLADTPVIKSLPNVKVFPTKRKPSHTDEELGRKKVIEAELRARGLIN